MAGNDDIPAALSKAWHEQSARSSLERWLELCNKEGWGEVPQDLPLLVGIFGASWYFTRYIFYRGIEAATLIDLALEQEFDMDSIKARLLQVTQSKGAEEQLELLRLLKNEIMLQILACDLKDLLTQKETEQALTNLANASLGLVLEIFDLKSLEQSRLAVFGMGRMAGDEMSFGSDLDLIFLFESGTQDDSYELSRKVRILMRNIAAAGSAGSLYEIDMRLRPHGTSGALLTSANSFLEYHQAECDIWERQMMTRCRAVIDNHGLGTEYLDRISGFIYQDYDIDFLREEIINMRKRVQDEKGTLGGKYEVKRGRGGIMDIDFLTHFLQLAHGSRHPELRTTSTRAALKSLEKLDLIPARVSSKLLQAYDLLKRTESSIRLFDMKPVSAFPVQTAAHLPVAAAMGYTGDNAGDFVEEYIETTDYVRRQFRKYVG